MNLKLLIVSTCCLLTNLIAFSQNWSLLNASCKYHYSPDSGGYSETVTLHVDSAEIAGSDSVFYLNRIISKRYPWMPEQNMPQFLQGTMTKRSNGDVHFSDTLSFLVRTLASTGTSWLFDSLNNITATVVSESYIPVHGSNDSVKHIALSSGDTIILSKNYGLIRFSVSVYDSVVYDLSGIEGMNLGMQVPGFLEVFNFNVGDVFEYRSSYSDGYGTGTWRNNGWNSNFRYTITTKQLANDNFSYGAEMVNRKITWQNHLPPQPNSYDTVYVQQLVTLNYNRLNFPDLNLDNYESNIADQYIDPNQGYSSGPLRMFLYEDSVFLSIGKGFFNALGYGPSTVKKEYAEGRGLVKYEESHTLEVNHGESWNTTLTGAIINGVTYGVIKPDSFYSDPHLASGLSIEVFPNPLHDELKIKPVNYEELKITLYDINSKNILQQSFSGSTTIYTDRLSPGVYVYEIKMNDDVIKRGKVVKQ